MRSPDASTRAGLGFTLLGAVLTETFSHLVPLHPLVGVSILLITLAAVAFTALRGGLAWGAASALILSAYALHYVGPHGDVGALDAERVQSAVIMLVIGLGIATPMAFIKKREDKLRDELRARAKDLEIRNAELVDLNATLEAFGYVVSHDLKEPVRAVENYLEAAEEAYGTPDGLDFTVKARASNARMARLLQGLLEYSRTSSSVTTPRAVAVRAVIESEVCRAQYEGLARERGARLDVATDLPEVLGDEVILAQLFGNLILNAVRHNPAGLPAVTISASEALDGRAHVVVADNGKGFPPDVLRRFERLKSTRPTTVGGGFGLVIAQRAVQRLGGRMWIENAPEGGARVHVELPKAPAPHDPQPEAPESRTTRRARGHGA